ncbi:hypothetical protein D3C78_945570 [compost metagenome]
MANHTDQQIAQRHARQPSHQQALIINQGADTHRIYTDHALTRRVDTQIDRKLEQQQKEGRRTDDLPKDTLRHQPVITICHHVATRGKHAISPPAEDQRNDKMTNNSDGFEPPGGRVVAAKQRQNNTGYCREAKKQHRGE